MKAKDLVKSISKNIFNNRPYRLDSESVTAYRAYLGKSAPQNLDGPDLAPTLEILTKLVMKMTEARLTNLERDYIEIRFRKGIWDDAWDGYFYYKALPISTYLANDKRLSQVPKYASKLKYFGEFRAFKKGKIVFIKRGAREASHSGNAISLPVESLKNDDDLNLKDLVNIFDEDIVGNLRTWLRLKVVTEPPVENKLPNYECDIFLSHSSNDYKEAKMLVNSLEEQSKQVFFSPSSLLKVGSTNYMKTIDDALDKSKHFILFGTQLKNISSSWVEAEWRLFINEMRSGRKKGNFLSVITPNIKISELPIAIRFYQIIYLEEGYFEKILNYV